MHDAQLLRYSRHILLAEIGIPGQARLNAAHALVVGAGGLGSPVALYLAASGIRHITIADPDVVEMTNLQRQIAHDMHSLGVNKAHSAAQRMAALNPDIKITPLDARLEGAALMAAVAQADVVLDCSDNFTTRHAVNRACATHHTPLVSGAAVGFDGQVSVFDLRDASAPCYACLFPEEAEEATMRCAEFGVFAPLVGIIGAMQAAEAIKLIADIGHSLSGRLLLFDALGAEWRQMKLIQDPNCPVCRAPGH